MNRLLTAAVLALTTVATSVFVAPAPAAHANADKCTTLGVDPMAFLCLRVEGSKLKVNFAQARITGGFDRGNVVRFSGTRGSGSAFTYDYTFHAPYPVIGFNPDGSSATFKNNSKFCAKYKASRNGVWSGSVCATIHD